jgi:hypothetical protein
MVVVAVVGLACGVTVLLRERRERFARMALQHSGARLLAWPSCQPPDAHERQRLLSKRFAAWHAEMARNYQHAARYPWLPVAPDPPKPERYFAHIRDSGPIPSGLCPFDIVVLAPDDGVIGMAFGAGRTDDGLALWQLVVHGADVPGRWVIVNREFRQVER